MDAEHVVVVGGGLSGLSAALSVADAGARVTVLEAAPRWGGQVRTARAADCIVEEGAEAFALGGDAMSGLIERLGLRADLVRQRDLPSFVLLNGALDRLTAGRAAAMLGIRSTGAEAAGLATFTDGMDTLPRRLTAELERRGAVLRATTAVHALRRERDRWIVATTSGEPLETAAVILCIPPAAARALLIPLAREPLEALSARSSLTVSLVYEGAAVSHPLDATGFVVPPETQEAGGVAACTFTSSKFPGRLTGRRVLLRLFFRPEPHQLASEPDAAWIERGHALLEPVLGITGSAGHAWVSRWPAALPDHGPAYAAAVRRLEETLAEWPGLYLAGAGYHWPGVEGAVRSGITVAGALAVRG